MRTRPVVRPSRRVCQIDGVTEGRHGLLAPIRTKEDLERLGMIVPDVRFADEIARFAQEGQASARGPEPAGIVFLGDSDIRLWSSVGDLAEDFRGLPVVNRGFGGARTWETLLYFDQLLPAHRPETIVYCCGDNDIARLKERGPTSAVTGFRLFLDLLADRAPEVQRVLYLAIHPSPSDEPLWGFIAQANEGLRQVCRESSGRAEFVDYLHLLLDEHGRPRPELFLPDQLHFTADFYQQLAAFIRRLI